MPVEELPERPRVGERPPVHEEDCLLPPRPPRPPPVLHLPRLLDAEVPPVVGVLLTENTCRDFLAWGLDLPFRMQRFFGGISVIECSYRADLFRLTNKNNRCLKASYIKLVGTLNTPINR